MTEAPGFTTIAGIRGGNYWNPGEGRWSSRSRASQVDAYSQEQYSQLEEENIHSSNIHSIAAGRLEQASQRALGASAHSIAEKKFCSCRIETYSGMDQRMKKSHSKSRITMLITML